MNLQDMSQDAVPEQAAGSKAQPASPELQSQFDILIGTCRTLIGKTAEQWMSSLKVDPVATAVHMGTRTVRHVVQMYEKEGRPFDPSVVMHAGVTVVKDIAGVANDAGLVPDDKLESFLKDVMQQSIAQYMRMDADEGLMPGEGGQLPPGDPATPSGMPADEGAESPEMAQQDMATAPPEVSEDGMSEEDAMDLQLQKIRGAK